MRPRQWVKNSFVLAPLIFSGQLQEAAAVTEALLAALLFCLASSTTYIINDLHDLENDRRHPVKSRTRPIASGQLSIRAATILLGILILLLATACFARPQVMLIVMGYLVLNLAYTYILKHQPIIDIFTIAIGFVLRIYAGAAAIDVPVSSWMSVTSLCLALYLAAIKRRQELTTSGTEGRKVLQHYTVAMVDRFAEMSGTGALLFYSLYVMSTRPELVITIPLVLYGLFRYWYIVEALQGGESPTDALLSDWQLILVVALWAGASAWMLLGSAA